MPYIGNTPAEKYAAFNVQNFTTSATTSYTLDRAVANELDIRLVINNVIQQPGVGKAYTAAGTTLTLSGATSGTDTMYAVYIGKAVQTVNPGAGSVGTTALADNAVTNAKLADATQGDVIYYAAAGAPAQLSAGTNGHFLKTQGAGANPTWAAIPAGGATLTGSTDNTVVTVTGANAIQGEANLTFDGSQLNIPTGSAGAPSLAHTGDPDTGIYFATNQINFATTGQNRVELLSDGNLSIRQENIKFETADKGIYLGTTTGAASNLLNDYEFGTFTPAFEPTNNSFTTKGGVAGYYTKIGKMVYAQVHLNVTTNGSASGNINVTNFPFTSADVGLTHTINRGRETQIDGSAFDVIMSRNVTAMVILAPPFGNGASYDLNTMYRVA